MPQTPRPAGLLRPLPTTIPEPDAAPQLIITDAEEELLTDEQVMAMLKVPKHWLRNHTTRTAPIIPHLKLGREIRYLRSDILQFLRSRRETRPTWERSRHSAN